MSLINRLDRGLYIVFIMRLMIGYYKTYNLYLDLYGHYNALRWEYLLLTLQCEKRKVTLHTLSLD